MTVHNAGISSPQTGNHHAIPESLVEDMTVHDAASSLSKTTFQGSIPPPVVSRSISDVFRDRVLEQGSAPAVCAWDGDLTYDELDSKSSLLAGLLTQRGIETGNVVALCFDRSVWVAVAVLAVSKAGAVLCLLEPEHPTTRMQQICKDINAKMILCSASQSRLATKLIDEDSIVIVNHELLTTTSWNGDLPDIISTQAAYVVFTSGSTGKPKGILVSHQALVTGVFRNQEPLCLSASSRILNFASFAFDVGVLEYYWSLLIGGCLCVPAESDRKNDLMGAMERLQVNWVFFTPSVARVLDPSRLSSLRYLSLGGEPITQFDLDMWLPSVHIVAQYGPAEISGPTTIQNQYSQMASPANIGFPASVVCWLVDESDHNVLVPTGSIGEIVVQGPAVSDGYINNPDQNAQLFISNPVWFCGPDRPNSKVYKTGDLARRLPDGSLIYLGRKDAQVKINGQRLEVQEVEHHIRIALGSNEGVAVEAIAAHRSSKRLFAFIVAENVTESSSDFLSSPQGAFSRVLKTFRSWLRIPYPSGVVSNSYRPFRSPIYQLAHTVTRMLTRRIFNFFTALRSAFSDLIKKVRPVYWHRFASYTENKFNDSVVHPQVTGTWRTDHLPSRLFLPPQSAFSVRMDEVKLLLKKKIPHYMVPEFYIPITHLPTTVTGKLDRRTLREQFELLSRAERDMYMRTGTTKKVMPRTIIESQLQRLWAQVLKLPLEEIGTDDDWVRLGGDSLTAMQLVSLARKEQLMLTVLDVFNLKNISSLSRSAESKTLTAVEETKPFELLGAYDSTNEQILGVIAEQCGKSEGSIEDAYPLTSLQVDAWSASIDPGYNFTLRLDFKLSPNIDLEKLTLAWEAVVATHPILRTRIVELTKDKFIQAVLNETIPLDDLNGPKKAEYQEGSDLWGSGKRLVRVATGSNRLVMLIHHALYDGQSLGMLFRAISDAYNGQTLTLRKYAPFVRWASSSSPANREFWTQKFAGFDHRVFPPMVESPPPFAESRELTGRLNVVNDGLTMTNKIRLAFAIAVSWHYDTNDVVFGAALARRSAPIADIHDSAVPCTAALPDRIQLEPQETLAFNLEKDLNNVLGMILNENIDDLVIEGLSSECAAACLYGTILIMQPDLDLAYPEMFRERDARYSGSICALNALMQCSVESDHASVSLRLSEGTIKGTYRWDKFMDDFQKIFHFIQRNPEIKLCDIQSELGSC